MRLLILVVATLASKRRAGSVSLVNIHGKYTLDDQSIL